MNQLFLKLSKVIFKNSKVFLLIWFIFLTLSIITLIFNKNDTMETELTGISYTEAYQVKEVLEKEFKFKLGSSAAIVIEGQPDLNELEKGLKKAFPQILKILEIKGHSKHTNKLLYIGFSLEYPVVKMQSLTGEIRDYLKTWEKNGLKTYVTGNTAFQYDAKIAGKKDSKKGESFGFIICIFIFII
jgi:hypothetical protein